jgi:transposase
MTAPTVSRDRRTPTRVPTGPARCQPKTVCVPLVGVKAFSYRRVKNDQRDAADLADLLRMGRLPEAWIAPPATRELREWVRHRAKLVGLRSNRATGRHQRSLI